MGGVEGGEEFVGEGVGVVGDGDGGCGGVDAGEEVARGEVPVGVAGDELALEFELDDGDGFLHAGEEELVALAGEFDLEAGGGVGGVDGLSEIFEGGEEDAVAFFELFGAAVAEGEADDRGDAGFVAEAGAEPVCVVVAPEDVDVGLAHEEVDDFVDAGSAVAEVAGDEDFGGREVADESGRRADRAPVAVLEFVSTEHEFEEGGGPHAQRFPEKLLEEFAVFDGEEGVELFAAPGAGEEADEFELAAEGAGDPLAAGAVVEEFGAEGGHEFGGVVDDGEEFALLGFGEGGVEEGGDGGAEGSGGVVDDVAEFGVFAVDVGDDVDGVAGEGEAGAEGGEFAEGGGGVGVGEGEGVEEGELGFVESGVHGDTLP